MMASFNRKTSQKSTSRKSHTLIESPIVKRSQNQPVTLQSWLLKRGSEGLMLWKKRWCVLSDYCLFYYKDQCEDKLLGSLILASYKISACNPEEKGYKKYSFKAEHTNMKTFYFAAENQSHMEEWMKALKCASLLEGNYSDGRKKSPDPRLFPQANRYGEEMQPVANTDLLMGKSPEPQPVYANAPPKPKRLNDSSSPECSIEIPFRDENYHNYQGPAYHLQHSTSGQTQTFATSPPQHANYERRTPDIYGRANFVQPVTKPVNLNNLYIQDEQTVINNFSKDQIISYTPKTSLTINHSRPHSVDFLEYASKTESSALGSDIIDKTTIPYRPKSSLSVINTNEEEGTHWSAEEYARKMRQSSMYVKPQIKTSIPLKNEPILPNKNIVPQNSTLKPEQLALKTDLFMKSERSHSSLYRSQYPLESSEKPFFRSASARLFRPMSPIVQLNELKPHLPDHNIIGSSGTNKNPDNAVHNMSPNNPKPQQRDKPLERLMQWKERMSQSSLQRKNAEKTITDQPGSYAPQKRKPINNVTNHDKMTITNELMPFCEGETDGQSTDSCLQTDETSVELASQLNLCSYSPDNHGFEESETNQENLTVNVANDVPIEKRNFEIHNKFFNEKKRSSNQPDSLEVITNKINNTYDQFENKGYLNIKAKYSLINKDEPPTRNIATGGNEMETHKKKIMTEELNKKGSRKHLPSKPNINETEKDEEWGTKLDESRVIKEFSYHYITADNHDDCADIQNNDVPSNLKSRFRKTSIAQNKHSLQENQHDSQITSLSQSDNFSYGIRNNDLSKKCNNNIMIFDKKENNICQKINNKSQRKSIKSGIINKGCSLRSFRKETVNSSMKFHDNFEKRQVQSDSEALLYDTSSDIEENPIFNREHLEKTVMSSDNDPDDEVAAVLANEKNFSASNFESVNLQSTNCSSLDSEAKSTHSSKGIIGTESVMNKIELETNTCYEICHEKNHSTSTDMNSDIQEENYMPMTPRKKSSKNEVIHSRSNSASHSLIIENLLGVVEESPYVEMSQNGPSNSSHVSNSYQQVSSNTENQCSYSATPENPRYCEIGKNKDTQYEFIYNKSMLQEPVYMEVSVLKDSRNRKASFSLMNDKNTDPLDFNQNNSKENIRQSTSRPSLPDILNTTTPSLNQGSGRSDSSDADDEASKDLDSLDAPRHPRFSLSDTFRPASYYLGGSLGDRTIIALNSEHPDSSDSDLVSPPPIPTSSPPLDDLDISMDSTIINKDNSVQVQIKNDSTSNYKNKIFNDSMVKELRSSYKFKKCLRNSNTNLYEASSEESVDYEKREQRLKRRPLSADILSSLQDFNFITPSSEVEIADDSENGKLKEIYSEENESIDSSNLFSSKSHKHKNRIFNNSFPLNHDDMAIDIYDCEILDDFRYKENRLNQPDPIYEINFSDSSQKNDGDKVNFINQYENLRGFDGESNDCKIVFEKERMMDDRDSGKDKYSTFNIFNAYTNCNIQHPNTAPYYYSDLLKVDTKNFQEYEKNKWDNHIISDVNENISTAFSSEKNVCYHSLSECGSINNKPSMSDIYKDEYSSPAASHIINCEKQISKKYSPTPDYFDNSCDINHDTKIFPQSQSKEVNDLLTPHRSRSLEGLLENHDNSVKKYETDLFQKNSIVRLLKTQSQKTSPKSKAYRESSPTIQNKSPATPDIWEEDSLWRESLRKVSIRHTRSLEDLDRKDGPQTQMLPSSKNIEEAYENLNISSILDINSHSYNRDNPNSINMEFLKNDMNKKNEVLHNNFKKCEIKKKNIGEDNLIKPDIESMKGREVANGPNSSFEIDREKLRQWDLMSSAPAMLSSNRAVIKPITERNNHFPPPSLSGNETRAGDPAEPLSENKNSEVPSVKSETNCSLQQEQEQGQGWNLKVSAGELLGRTHEELVLLLIQLRRQRATVCQSMEKCHRDIEAQACLSDLDKTNRVDHLQKLDELKAHLADLEKQYEKGKPLVNLVDNMVKLGSLYQAGSPEKLEFIQRIQEQRLLAEEKRDWERIRPDHHELKAKVERLYRLDKLLQEESGTLHSLQQDKGVLERALGGLRTKLQGIHGNSPETEWYKRQQRLLEKELSRVRSILALNSKKLEETVAENARLEQELVVLRQKLQLSRRTAEPGGSNTAALEAELCQVQLLVGNLLRQRQELSLQVRQLTEKSNSLSRQIWPNSSDNIVENCNSGKKNLSIGWVETDLDAEVMNDMCNSTSCSNRNVRQHPHISPLYVNTASERDIQCLSSSPYQDELFETSAFGIRNSDFNRLPEINDDEIMKQSYGFQLKEKPQEIKTVRIVKRESERRQRDRDRSGNIGIPITYSNSKRLPITEERCADKEKSERESEVQDELEPKSSDPPPTPGPRTDSVNAVWNLVRKNRMKGKMANKNDSLIITDESPQLSPVYLSETARKIVEEVAWQGMGEKRLVPKEKRRHHTVSGPSLSTPQNIFSQTGSRDDLDIERVLRPRLTTPDVVRSTLIRVDPHYTKETIDNLLGAPGKIIIPERYIPESQPQLSKEEQNKRSKKADAIRKMLCETTAVAPKDNDVEGNDNTSSLKRKVAEEKKNREHLLQLSHILAQQVMEKSKIVAGGNSTPLD